MLRKKIILILLRFKRGGGEKFLILPGAKIQLSQRFKDTTQENYLKRIYQETGLVFDFETVNMLVAMEQTVKRKENLLRLIGPTGLGKTFTSRGYSILRGSKFFSNPINPEVELTDLIGSLDYDENQRMRFNSETSFKKRLENGGVIALSELNTLMDVNNKAALAWWLLQIAQIPPDEDGYKTIELSEIPVAHAGVPHTIRIHPETLIVMDVNPMSFEGRGDFPEIFKEETPSHEVKPLVDPGASVAQREAERKKISLFARMFLNMPWIKNGKEMAAGIRDEVMLKEITESLTAIYIRLLVLLSDEQGSFDRTTFSLRELKRMAEDIQYDLEKGMDMQRAILRSVVHHIIVRFKETDRKKLIESLMLSAHQKELSAFLQDFLDDQLFNKLRPVHLRVSPEVQTRSLLNNFQERNDIELVYPVITRETDRFKLEGGRVIGYDGKSFQTAGGLFSYIIEQDKKTIGKKKVYVFENIHNLPVETAVAMNEILQGGTLHIAGQDKNEKLPPILAISRGDSEMEWSDAEQSRLVSFHLGGDSNGWKSAKTSQELDHLFSSLNILGEVSNQIRNTIINSLDIVISATREDSSLFNRFSEANLLHFIKRLEWGLEKNKENLSTEDLIRNIQEVFMDTFLLGLPDELRNPLEESIKKNVLLLGTVLNTKNIFKEEEGGEGRVLKTNVRSKEDLDFLVNTLKKESHEAQVAAVMEIDTQRRRTIMKRLSQLFENNKGPIEVAEVKSESLEEGDIIRAMLKTLEKNLGGKILSITGIAGGFSAVTESGKLFIIREGKEVEIKELGEWVTCVSSIKGGMVVGTLPGNLHIIRDGQPVEVKHLESQILQVIEIEGGVLAGTIEGDLYAVRQGQPDEVKRIESWMTSGIGIEGGFAVTTFEGKLHISQDGKLQEVKEFESKVSSVGSIKDRLAVGTFDGNIHIIKNGEVVEVKQLQSRVVSISEIEGGFSAITLDGNLHIYREGKGDEVKEFESRVTSVSEREGQLAVGTEDGALHVFEMEGIGFIHDNSVYTPDGQQREMDILSTEVDQLIIRQSGAERKISSSDLQHIIREIQLEAVNSLDKNFMKKILGEFTKFVEQHKDGMDVSRVKSQSLKDGDVITDLFKVSEKNLRNFFRAMSAIEGGLLIGTEDGDLHIFREGKPVEIIRLRSLILSVSSTTGGFLVGTADGNLHIFQEGKSAEIINFGSQVLSVTEIEGGFAVGTEDEHLHIFREGKEIEVLDLKSPVWTVSDIEDGIIAGTKSGGLHIFRKGQEPEILNLESPIFSASGIENGFAAGTEEGKLHVFRKGEPVEVINLRAPIWNVSGIQGGVAVAILDGGLHLLRKGKQIEVIDFETPVWTVREMEGGLAVGTEDGKLHILKLKIGFIHDNKGYISDGKVLDKKDLPSEVDRLTVRSQEQEERVSPSEVREKETGPISLAGRNIREKPFQSHYEDKPYYFAIDRKGVVFLNYSGHWHRTRHKVLNESIVMEGENIELAYAEGKFREVRPLGLEEIRHPFKAGNVPLGLEDLLVSSENLERVERGIYSAFALGRHVNMEGESAAGKTSIASEIALLLGLPFSKFQMHGEREIADLLGGYRDDAYRRKILSSRPKEILEKRIEAVLGQRLAIELINKGIFVADPYDGKTYWWGKNIMTTVDLKRELEKKGFSLSKAQWQNLFSLFHYRLPLLEFITHGGIFIPDEGAMGDAGQGLFTLFSPTLHGDKKIIIVEFPGFVMEMEVHEDFHLIGTSNKPGETASRQMFKSEIASNIQFVYVEEDDSPEFLAKVFDRFLGITDSLDTEKLKSIHAILSSIYDQLKSESNILGQDNPDRYYISKREIRRIASQIKHDLLINPQEDIFYLLYKAQLIVYEAMYSHPKEREAVHEIIQKEMKNIIEDFTLVDNFQKTLQGEIFEELGGSALTDDEARIQWVANKLLDRREPVLLISENGARTGDIVQAMKRHRKADLKIIDASPEQGELEILGGQVPSLGKKTNEEERRSQFLRGFITKNLMRLSELTQLQQSPVQNEELVWIRNIDLWNEDIRTALNGLLEDGYIDLETDAGEIERFFKPNHVHFISDMVSDTGEDFSNAFFNRWTRIGVSAENIIEKNETSSFEKVLRGLYEFDQREAFLMASLFSKVMEIENNGEWNSQLNYGISPEAFYIVAEEIQRVKQTDPEWIELQKEIYANEYDPRESKPTNGGEEEVYEKYLELSDGILIQQILLLLSQRFQTSEMNYLSDRELFNNLLKAILKKDALPDFMLKRKEIDQMKLNPSQRLLYNTKTEKILAVLESARQNSRGVAISGETGASKTTTLAHFAAINNMKFYKYQCHQGSETSDLTVEFFKDEDGNIQKETKEFYELIREGNVVIDIDEGDVAPHILWVADAILRGEDMIYPAFPGEEPFQIGKNVVLGVTLNRKYDGRQIIDRRILEKMIQVHMELPSTEEKEKIIETFYDVWEMDQSKKEEVIQKLEPLDKIKQEVNLENVVHEGSLHSSHRVSMDRNVIEGEDTFADSDEDNDEMIGFEDYKNNPARGVFVKELYPNVRHIAYNNFDSEAQEFVSPERVEHILDVGPISSSLVKQIKRKNDVFVGHFGLILDSQWHIIPSAGADMRFLEMNILDSDGQVLDIGYQVGADSANNYYFRAKNIKIPREVILQYTVAVPAQYYGHEIPENIPFSFNKGIPAEVGQALERIGITTEENDYREVFFKIVDYFRDFQLIPGGISEDHESVYLDIVSSRCGVCRQRAGAFARTLIGIGMKATLVHTDVHAYVEVDIPGIGWMQIDLGGGGDPMRMSLAPLGNELHRPRHANNLPEPKNYLRDRERYAKRVQQALKKQGIEPKYQNRPNPSSLGDKEGASFDRDKEKVRISRDLKLMKERLTEKAQVHEDVKSTFQQGLDDAHLIFEKLKMAIQSGWRIRSVLRKKGLKIDPVSWLLRKDKTFIVKKRISKFQKTAGLVLWDFSRSLHKYRQAVAHSVATVGEGFWQMRDLDPEHFYYDSSFFTQGTPTTAIGMGQKIDEAENNEILKNMANKIGDGGTDLLGAMKYKLTNKDKTGFLDSQDAKGAKVKYVIVFTDGAGDAILEKETESGKMYFLTSDFKDLLKKYKEAGIDVFVVGFGKGAQQVEAFNGAGQHYVRIEDDRFADTASAIAGIVDLKSKGVSIPNGDITFLLGIRTHFQSKKKDNQGVNLIGKLFDEYGKIVSDMDVHVDKRGDAPLVHLRTEEGNSLFDKQGRRVEPFRVGKEKISAEKKESILEDIKEKFQIAKKDLSSEESKIVQGVISYLEKIDIYLLSSPGYGIGGLPIVDEEIGGLHIVKGLLDEMTVFHEGVEGFLKSEEGSDSLRWVKGQGLSPHTMARGSGKRERSDNPNYRKGLQDKLFGEVANNNKTEEIERENLGGINLDPNLFNLQTQGEKMEIKIRNNLQSFKEIKIDGLSPVIFQIAPTNLPVFIGASSQ